VQKTRKWIKIPVVVGPSSCKSICNKHNIGRGFLPTTWRNNYKDAQANGGCSDEAGKTVEIVKNLAKVDTDNDFA